MAVPRTVTPAWTSSNPAVASVDGAGRLDGQAHGSTTLTATFEGRSVSKTVQVVNNYEGTWKGRYVIRACDDSGIFEDGIYGGAYSDVPYSRGWCNVGSTTRARHTRFAMSLRLLRIRGNPLMHLQLRFLVRSVIIVLGLLLVSCDSKGPTEPAPTPPRNPSGQRSTGPIAFVSDRDGTEQIYLANDDGSMVTRLTVGMTPAWSRDGQRLAFHNAREIYVINVDGSGLRRVARGWDPAWSPDGQMLVFRGESFTIDVVDVDGANRRSLHDNTTAHPGRPGRRTEAGSYLVWGRSSTSDWDCG